MAHILPHINSIIALNYYAETRKIIIYIFDY